MKSGAVAPLSLVGAESCAGKQSIRKETSLGRYAFATLALISLLIAVASPAMARDASLAAFQEEQVSDYLLTRFEEVSTDRAWLWPEMVAVCTRILMNGNPEQNPESARVRKTNDSILFLDECARQKGFRKKKS